MSSVNCKRCDMGGLNWRQSPHGKWSLQDSNGNPHHCEDGKLKAVKCKYCNAADLHWAEEINPVTQWKKAVLTESYGLPHACDERMAFIAKEKKDKKDKYEAEKKRVTNHPDGKCPTCNGTGYAASNSTLSPFGVCDNCHGQGYFTHHTRKRILANVRQKIWPNMASFKRGW